MSEERTPIPLMDYVLNVVRHLPNKKEKHQETKEGMKICGKVSSPEMSMLSASFLVFR